MKARLKYADFFRGKKITMMGLGVLGRGINVAKFLAECGASLTITDIKEKNKLESAVRELKKFKNIKYVFGKHRLFDFRDKDMVIKAAGVPLDSPYIKEARKNKIPAEMDASLFAKLAKDVVIVGITGTKGKSTVTHLVYEIIKNSGRRVHLGGNVKGMATLPLLKKINPPAGGGDIVVMELDSWQLQGFKDAKISPRIAVFTNFMRDHMNYYQNSVKNYFSDKAGIFKDQKENDFLITGEQVRRAIRKFYKGKIKSKIIIPRAGDIPKNWMIKIPGRHNLENIALAIEAARKIGVRESVIKKTAESFKGAPGRLEFIKEIKGVKFYNDTTATTPEAAVAALETFGEKKGRIILIGGGADKNLKYNKYAKAVKRCVKTFILFRGEASNKILKELRIKNYELSKENHDITSMKDAVRLAKENMAKGDIVLLSPGAASFGVFKNEFDRGEQFVREVKKLK